MTDKLREAAQQALGALVQADQRDGMYSYELEIAALRTALAQQDAQAVPHLLPEHETEAMHNAVMAVMYQGVTRTNTDALWQAYRRAMLNASPTPPAQRVMLTDEEIRDLWSWSMTAEAERTANTQQHAFAQGVIEAYETKNGINRG